MNTRKKHTFTNTIVVGAVALGVISFEVQDCFGMVVPEQHDLPENVSLQIFPTNRFSAVTASGILPYAV